MRAVPRLCIVYPGIRLTTEENQGKPQSGYPKGAQLKSAERDSFSRLACRPLLPFAFTSGDGVKPRLAYLPSCRTRGFPTSANFESKLTVRALMWSANNGTPRSSCICLVLTWQGAPVARRRHLDCNTYSLRTLLRAADLHAGHA
jgi:hypothetical protein